MSYISFAWTTPALLAGQKTVTRRAWTAKHAAQFHAGDVVDVWDKSPRNGGKKIARIELTRDPYLERTTQMTLDSYRREGLLWLNSRGYAVPEDLSFERWRDRDELVYVVEFELLDVLG